MSITVANPDAAVSEELRARLRAANMVPLWESNHALHGPDDGPQAHIWRWAETYPILLDVARVSDPQVIARRVLTFVDPDVHDENHQSTTGVLSTCLQLLNPGEVAPPHRHSMNALRFVLEGSGSRTIVDGKSCAMEYGDLILTPAWTWHEHINEGTVPTIWLDGLDVGLHLALGTNGFQPGPISGTPAVQYEDATFAVPNILPDTPFPDRDYSPVFRYPYEDAVAALENTPPAPDGSRRVRYANPLTGGPCLAAMDCTMIEIPAGATTEPFVTTASSVVTVVAGGGTSQVGRTSIDWTTRDSFSLPQGKLYSHTATSDARLFVLSNREVYRRLGILEEGQGDPQSAAG